LRVKAKVKSEPKVKKLKVNRELKAEAKVKSEKFEEREKEIYL